MSLSLRHLVLYLKNFSMLLCFLVCYFFVAKISRHDSSPTMSHLGHSETERERERKRERERDRLIERERRATVTRYEPSVEEETNAILSPKVNCICWVIKTLLLQLHWRCQLLLSHWLLQLADGTRDEKEIPFVHQSNERRTCHKQVGTVCYMHICCVHFCLPFTRCPLKKQFVQVI